MAIFVSEIVDFECKVFIFPRKRLGKVAMSHKLVAFEHFNEK